MKSFTFIALAFAASAMAKPWGGYHGQALTQTTQVANTVETSVPSATAPSNVANTVLPASDPATVASVGATGVPSDTATLATATAPTASSTGVVPAGSYTGDITYYNVSDGAGSCGQAFSNTDMVVALSTTMMANGANPNNNPKCYTYITLTNPANPGSWQGKIVSTCEGCATDDVDLSPSLFAAVAPTGNGRLHGIVWHFT